MIQLLRYQELSEKYRDLGAPELFQTVQLCVVTCLQDALYGTMGTPGSFYLPLEEPWPHEQAAIEAALGEPATPQDVLLYGMLSPDNRPIWCGTLWCSGAIRTAARASRRFALSAVFGGEQSGCARKYFLRNRQSAAAWSGTQDQEEPDHAVAGTQAGSDPCITIRRC